MKDILDGIIITFVMLIFVALGFGMYIVFQFLNGR
jgi:hypothetical protein